MAVRLGYAGINMTLAAEKDGPRLRSITAKRLGTMDAKERRAQLYQVARSNLKTLTAVLRWNAAQSIKLFRVTSDLIPLATHPITEDWDWESDLAAEFTEAAAVARETGARVTMHPGQYTVLNAKDPEIVSRAVADLVYHARVLELLGGAPDWGMVLHVGGAYGDKQAAQERFVDNFAKLPDQVKGRLWVENDDRTFDTEAALWVARAVGRPMILDVHHHRVLRDDDWAPWLEPVLGTWGKVRPKLHFSSPRNGQRSREHADNIDPVDFRSFLDRLGDHEVDVMLECKLKDQALLRLRRSLNQ